MRFRKPRACVPQALAVVMSVLVSCAAPPLKGPSTHTASPTQDVEALVAQFRAANRPSMTNGIPGASSMPEEERNRWCDRLTHLAESRLSEGGDAVSRASSCALTLQPTREHTRVPGVRVVFDVEFYFRKPYASASFDTATRTLFLPVVSLESAWWEQASTIHEWRHAYHDALARKGDLMALALQSTFEGPDYLPDAFHADEVPVNACDILDARRTHRAVEAWRPQMAKAYGDMLEKELVALAEARGTPRLQSGLPGLALDSPEGTKRWLGGNLNDARRKLGEVLALTKKALADGDTSPLPAELETLCALP